MEGETNISKTFSDSVPNGDLDIKTSSNSATKVYSQLVS